MIIIKEQYHKKYQFLIILMFKTSYLYMHFIFIIKHNNIDNNNNEMIRFFRLIKMDSIKKVPFIVNQSYFII